MVQSRETGTCVNSVGLCTVYMQCRYRHVYSLSLSWMNKMVTFSVNEISVNGLLYKSYLIGFLELKSAGLGSVNVGRGSENKNHEKSTKWFTDFKPGKLSSHSLS